MLPDAQVVPTIHCNVDPEIVMTDRTRVPLLVNFNELDHHQHNHESGGKIGTPRRLTDFHSYLLPSNPVLYLTKCALISLLSICRGSFSGMTGPVRFRDRTVLVNYVGGKKEWSAWDGENETCLVFIGWSVSEEETMQKLKNCLEAKEG